MAHSPVLRYAIALAVSCAIATLLPELDGHSGWSLFPPLAAILVAVASGNLVLGLATAIVGASVLTAPQTSLLSFLVIVLERAAVEFVWQPLSESFQVYVLLFTIGLIGMVRIIALAGGTQGIAAALARRAGGARSTRLATFLLGLAIFFDDYANTMVLGTTMRPVTDRFHIPREKLAYIVDSTAAPVAGIAIISTWIGYEVGIFEDIMKDVGAGISGYELFFRAIPSRFYCFLALTFVVTTILLQRDFGPMLGAERRSQTGPTAAPSRATTSEPRETAPGVRASAVTAAVPVAVVIFGVAIGVQLDTLNHPDVVTARYEYSVWSHRYWTVVFSFAYTPKVMFLASLAGIAVAVAFALAQKDSQGKRILLVRDVCSAWLGGQEGMKRIAMIIVILSLAWAIKEACDAVDTSSYILASLRSTVDPASLPVITFFIASAIAFSIGTSWATMAILLPTVLPVAYELGEVTLVVPTAAAVLDGAIFGDHCSPISDTTVLSSIACECDLVDHVKTQLPYAVSAMLAAAAFGYIGSAFFYPAYAGLALGVGAVVLVVRFVGRHSAV